MPYRFRLEESFESGFRRNAKEQIAKAHKYLAFNDDQATSIHETRKCLKRLRAILRLFRPALGKSDFAHENARYRDIARLLSTSRDNTVMLATVDTLLDSDIALVKKERNRKKIQSSLQDVRNRLAQHVMDPNSAADGARSDVAAKRRAIAMLDDAQHELGVLQLKGSGFSTVAGGLRRGYQSGIKGFMDARTSLDDDTLHEWRKSVQLHWRHMALLQEAWPEYFLFRAQFAKELSDTLGRHNDLGLVANFVRTIPVDEMSSKSARAVCKFIRKIQKQLWADAIEMGSMLYADDPDDLKFQIERYWKVARKYSASKTNATSMKKDAATARANFSAAKLFKLKDVH